MQITSGLNISILTNNALVNNAGEGNNSKPIFIKPMFPL